MVALDPDPAHDQGLDQGPDLGRGPVPTQPGAGAVLVLDHVAMDVVVLVEVQEAVPAVVALADRVECKKETTILW